MRDLTDDLAEIRRRLGEAETYLGLEASRKRLAELEPELGRPDLWDDQAAAQRVTREYNQAKADVDELEGLEAQIADSETLYGMALDEDDEGVLEEVDQTITGLRRLLGELEMRSLFAGEHDGNDAVCEIHAGAGGTDAQDWAEMMLRMYQRWGERRGFAVEIDDITVGQEAGILSATFIMKGRYAYGLLSSERGVHRLVRISPFGSHRRETSFASLEVTPFIEDTSGEVDIDDKDLRIDTYRSSGAGGQHVNVTDSAVRITHLPTGVVVAVQNERSQHQNKAKAMQILAAKLIERQREERDAALSDLAGPKSQVGWGAQIRSYVLAPYQLVKDLRSDHETGSVQAVLDGDLEPFMEAFLRWRRAGQAEP